MCSEEEISTGQLGAEFSMKIKGNRVPDFG